MKFILHQTELNQGLLSWTVRHFRIHSNRAWICDTVHTHFMNLHVSFFFQDSAISYAIFRSLNSCTLFNSLLDFTMLSNNELTLPMPCLLRYLHSPIKVHFWKVPSWTEKQQPTMLLPWILFLRRRGRILNYYTNFQ